MPKYEYKCVACNNHYEVEKSMKDARRVEYCPSCELELVRVFDATPNKWNTTGAYVTDNR